MYEQQFNPYAANLAVVKDYFKSSKVLFLGILYCISAVLSIVASVFSASSIASYANDFISAAGFFGLDLSEISSEVEQAVSAASAQNMSSTVIGAIISSAVVILTAVAFFLIYSKSRSEDPAAGPGAGIGILYVLAVIGLVFTVIGLVAVVLLGILLIALSSSIVKSSDELQAAGPAVSLILVAVVIAALLAMGYALFVAISQKRFFGSVKASLNSVELQNKGAGAYGVACVINGIFTIFSVLSLIGTLVGITKLGFSSAMTVTAILSLFSAIVNVILLFTTASLAFGYKKHINNMKYGYNGSVPYAGVRTDYAAPQQPTYNDSYAGYNAAPQQPAYHDSFTGTAPQTSRAGFCPNCGAPVDSSAPFCGNCGTKL